MKLIDPEWAYRILQSATQMYGAFDMKVEWRDLPESEQRKWTDIAQRFTNVASEHIGGYFMELFRHGWPPFTGQSFQP